MGASASSSSCWPDAAVGLLLAVALDAAVAQPGDDGQRVAAVEATAQQHRACLAIQPFYWEIGRGTGRVAGGTVGGTEPQRDTEMPFASATKLLYASYVAERRAGALTAGDVKSLGMRSGYTSFVGCNAEDSVGSCAARRPNSERTAAHEGRFFYDGSHMQQHAADSAGMGLAALDNAGLAAELHRVLGAGIALQFVQPQPSAGGRGTPAGYARVLQQIVAGELRMRELLGRDAVQTHPGRYPDEAVFSPTPPHETWRYSIGHWIEGDEGDGAYTSPGVFGFYPWIDATKTSYGLVARTRGIASPHVMRQPAMQSALCGRAIRRAWAGRPTE